MFAGSLKVHVSTVLGRWIQFLHKDLFQNVKRNTAQPTVGHGDLPETPGGANHFNMSRSKQDDPVFTILGM